jgi:hypothetical protein
MRIANKSTKKSTAPPTATPMMAPVDKLMPGVSREGCSEAVGVGEDAPGALGLMLAELEVDKLTAEVVREVGGGDEGLPVTTKVCRVTVITSLLGIV